MKPVGQIYALAVTELPEYKREKIILIKSIMNNINKGTR